MIAIFRIWRAFLRCDVGLRGRLLGSCPHKNGKTCCDIQGEEVLRLKDGWRCLWPDVTCRLGDKWK